jgi:hypothetical protein
MADAPEGDIFKSYDPQGGMGGMFAPGYIKGYAPSEDAVQKWTAENQGMNAGMIEQTRMPNEWVDPNAGVSPYAAMGLGMGPYGAGRIPNNLQFNPNGSVDPEALRVAAQGGKYDMDARRNAIAQRVQSNAVASAPKPAANPWAMYGYGSGFMGGWNDPFANEPATSRGGGG